MSQKPRLTPLPCFTVEANHGRNGLMFRRGEALPVAMYVGFVGGEMVVDEVGCDIPWQFFDIGVYIYIYGDRKALVVVAAAGNSFIFCARAAFSRT